MLFHLHSEGHYCHCPSAGHEFPRGAVQSMSSRRGLCGGARNCAIWDGPLRLAPWQCSGSVALQQPARADRLAGRQRSKPARTAARRIAYPPFCGRYALRGLVARRAQRGAATAAVLRCSDGPRALGWASRSTGRRRVAARGRGGGLAPPLDGRFSEACHRSTVLEFRVSNSRNGQRFLLLEHARQSACLSVCPRRDSPPPCCHYPHRAWSIQAASLSEVK